MSNEIKRGRPPAQKIDGLCTISEIARERGLTYGAVYRYVRQDPRLRVQLIDDTYYVDSRDIAMVGVRGKHAVSSGQRPREYITLQPDADRAAAWIRAANGATLPSWLGLLADHAAQWTPGDHPTK